MIRNWIFLKSTRKGLLKIVQDRISRPIGSREIQRIKVERVLLDTLYVCENSQDTESQPPTLLRSGLEIFFDTLTKLTKLTDKAKAIY